MCETAMCLRSINRSAAEFEKYDLVEETDNISKLFAHSEQAESCE